jgi:hypothetical protein
MWLRGRRDVPTPASAYFGISFTSSTCSHPSWSQAMSDAAHMSPSSVVRCGVAEVVVELTEAG